MSASMQRNLPFLSTPRYTQSNVSPHNFDHFCTRQEALDVPQRLIFTNEYVVFRWKRPSGQPCLRETPTFKHVHPSALLQLH